MNNTVILILDQSSFNAIFNNNDLMEYYNYIAKVYKQIENYKHNQINFTEYVVTLNEINEHLIENNIKFIDIQEDLNLLLQIPVVNRFKSESFIRVPDYLLKKTDSFALPIQIVSEEIGHSMLFNNYELSKTARDEIQKIINQYCFEQKEIINIKPMIAQGQSTKVSNKLLSIHTYYNTNYKNHFQDNILQNKNCDTLQVTPSNEDDLFILENEHKMFVVKLVHLYFEGSYYEYRNFLYNNPSIVSNIAQVIHRDINKKYNNKYIVKPIFDRFVMFKDIEEVYSRMLNLYSQISLYKDVEFTDLAIPSTFNDIDVNNLKFMEDRIMISNFLPENVGKIFNTNSKKNIKSKSNDAKRIKTEVDLMREIHEKKFPGVPFLHDEE